MIKKVNNWIDIIQYSLLSPTCILCDQPGMKHFDLCTPCFRALPREKNRCYCCAIPFSDNSTKHQLCGQCQKAAPAFDNTYTPFTHQGTIRYLINQLKFNGAYKNSRILGLLLARYLAKNADLPELIIPVPLHPRRYRQRGFNQTYEIAKIISAQLNIPIDITSSQRVKNTPHQISLNAKERHKNIEGAFQIINPLNVSHVAILDDVLTTGATANELAKVLKSAGISRVDIWVCARARKN